MYARVTTLQFYPEKMEEGVQIAREMAVPDIQQQQAAKIASHLVQAPTVEFYEVAFQG